MNTLSWTRRTSNIKDGRQLESIHLVSGDQTEQLYRENPRATQKSFLDVFTVRGWIWEILGLVAATISLIGAAALLLFYSDKPAPKWQAGLTLNAVLSIAATLYRGGLAVPIAAGISQFGWLRFEHNTQPLDKICQHDNASRGPMGSLLFLRKSNLANLGIIGALVTVLATTFGVCFQQSIRYTLRSVVDDTQVAETVGATMWNGITGPMATFAAAGNTVPYNMKAGIYSDLMSSGSVGSRAPLFSCPSGNCTWDPFSTLGASLQCVDFTTDVKLECQPGNSSATSGYNATYLAFCEEDKYNDGGCWRLAREMIAECNITGGSNPWLQNLTSKPLSFMHFTMETNVGRDLFFDTVRTSIFKDISAVLGVTYWIKVLGGLAPANNTQPFSWTTTNTTYEAKLCATYLSVQEIEARVENGIYTERIIREQRQMNNSETLRQKQRENPDYAWISPWQIDAGEKLVFEPHFEHTPAEQHAARRAFEIAAESYYSLSSYLFMIRGNVTSGQLVGAAGSTDIAAMLYHASNTTQILENTAKSISNVLRGNDTLLLRQATQNNSIIASNQRGIGKTYVQVQYVQVRLAWLLLPAICWILTIGLLVAAIVQTHGSEAVGVWKSSPMAALLHGRMSDTYVEQFHSTDSQLLKSEHGLEKLAARLQSRLVQAEDLKVRSTLEIRQR